MENYYPESMMQIMALLVHLWPVVMFLLVIFAVIFIKAQDVKWHKVWIALFLIWGIIAGLFVILAINNVTITGIISESYNLPVFIGIGVISGFISIGSVYHRYLSNRLEVKDQNSLTYLQAMDPHEFELLISDFFESLGYRTRPYEDRQDHGVDVIVYDGKGEKWIVQCKRYQGVVGEPILRDLLGTMLHEKASKAFLITTGQISRKARIWIEDKPIVVYEGEALIRILNALKKKQQSAA